MATRSARPIFSPHLHWNLQSTSSRMRTLGVVLMIDGRVETTLGSVSIIDGNVDLTEFSVHMTLGGLSWSSRTPTWSSKSAIVKSKLGSYLRSGESGRDSPSLLLLRLWLRPLAELGKARLRSPSLHLLRLCLKPVAEMGEAEPGETPSLRLLRLMVWLWAIVGEPMDTFELVS